MKYWTQFFGNWPARFAALLCLVNPIVMFSLRGSLPENIVGWVLLIPATVIVIPVLSLPAITGLIFMHYARRAVTRWIFLALAAGATAWVTSVISYPFKTASSMAVTTMNAPITASALLVVVCGIILYLEKRLK